MSTMCALRLPPAAPTVISRDFVSRAHCAIANLARNWSQQSITADTSPIFWRAVCLDNLGRRDEARRAYEEYLQHGGVERRGEATRKRRKLAP